MTATTTRAQPYVLGKRIMLPRWPKAVPVQDFSCHMAAVAALIRLEQPDFKLLSGDDRGDLFKERGLAERIETINSERLKRKSV